MTFFILRKPGLIGNFFFFLSEGNDCKIKINPLNVNFLIELSLIDQGFITDEEWVYFETRKNSTGS